MLVVDILESNQLKYESLVQWTDPYFCERMRGRGNCRRFIQSRALHSGAMRSKSLTPERQKPVAQKIFDIEEKKLQDGGEST